MKTSKLSSQNGASLVEAALVIPVFLLFVVGAISVFQVLYAHLVVSEALRKVARAEAIEGSADVARASGSFANYLNNANLHYTRSQGANFDLTVEPFCTGDPAEPTRRLLFEAKIEVECVLCNTFQALGGPPLHFSKAFEIPLEDQSLACPPPLPPTPTLQEI